MKPHSSYYKGGDPTRNTVVPWISNALVCKQLVEILFLFVNSASGGEHRYGHLFQNHGMN